MKDKMIAFLTESCQARSLGKRKEASVLFVDVVDYVELAERASLLDVVNVLSRYFRIAGKIVKESHGRIIDYYGDGFLALFGLDGRSDHSAHVIQAGFALQEAMHDFNEEVNGLVGRDFKIRLGAHTGPVIWGKIGIEGMRKMAAMGDTVNFASRIEQANKSLNTSFLISEPLYQQFDQSSTVAGSYEIQAKGKSGTHRVYALDYTLTPRTQTA